MQETKRGWCNVYADLGEGKLCSTNLDFYETEEEAKQAYYIGPGIVRIATIFIDSAQFEAIYTREIKQ